MLFSRGIVSLRLEFSRPFFKPSVASTFLANEIDSFENQVYLNRDTQGPKIALSTDLNFQ